MLMAAGDTTLAELAHRRLEHLHYRGLQKLTSSVDGKIPLEPCEDCLKAKHTTKYFRPSDFHASSKGDLIHADVVSFEVESINNGHKYFVTFIDDLSRFGTIFLLSIKSQVVEALQMFDSRFFNQNQRHISVLRSDGREFFNEKMTTYLDGIFQQSSCAHTPEEYSKVERPIGLLLKVPAPCCHTRTYRKNSGDMPF
jgi:hypothetical protein